MNAVARSEFFRIRKSKGTYVTIGILAGISVLMTGLALLLANCFGSQLGASAGDLISSIHSSTFFDGFITYASDGVFRIALLLLIGSMVAKMYQSGAAKQLVSSGISRSQIIFGQFKAFAIAVGVITFILSAVAGVCNLLMGKLGTVDPVRFGIAVLGILVVVTTITALSMLVSHLTGSIPGTLILGAAVLFGGGTVVNLLATYTGISAFHTYWITTLMGSAVNMTCSMTTQLIAIGILAAITVGLLALTMAVFSKKEIR